MSVFRGQVNDASGQTPDVKHRAWVFFRQKMDRYSTLVFQTIRDKTVLFSERASAVFGGFLGQHRNVANTCNDEVNTRRVAISYTYIIL